MEAPGQLPSSPPPLNPALVITNLTSGTSVKNLSDRAALTGKHDTLVRRAPGWQGAPDGQQAKN